MSIQKIYNFTFLSWKPDNLYYHNYKEEEDFTLETVEDCFDDVPKPRFGLVVKITKDVTCESEINCPVPVSPENYYFQSRQTGEGFRSSATPDCRVIVNWSLTRYELMKIK